MFGTILTCTVCLCWLTRGLWMNSTLYYKTWRSACWTKIKTRLSYECIWRKIHSMEKNDGLQLDQTAIKDEKDLPSEVDCTASLANNPFNKHFEGMIKDIGDKISNTSDGQNTKSNRSCCPQFFRFIQSYLPEMPLWSGVLLGSLDRYKKTTEAHELSNDHPYLSITSANAKSEDYIEGAMRHLKQEDFPGKKRLRPDDFVSQNYKRIRRRVNDFANRTHSNLRMKPKRSYKRKEGRNFKQNVSKEAKRKKQQPKAESYHTSQETWGKKEPPGTPKTNAKIGQFQQSPSIPLSETPDIKTKRTHGISPRREGTP